jgi:hypothetical protein
MLASHIALDEIRAFVVVASVVVSLILAAITVSIRYAGTGKKPSWQSYGVFTLIFFVLLCVVNFVILAPKK